MNEDFSEIIAAVKKFAVDNLSLSTLSDEELEEQIKTITDNMIGNRYVSIKNRVDIAQQVFSSIRGFGLLDTIMNDDTITEVMINGADNIFIEQAGRVKRLDESFESQRKLEDIIQRIVGKAGREVNQSNPIVDTRLPDGSRVNVVLPPIALCGPTVTIRKFSKTPMTIEKLISYGSITREIADKLYLVEYMRNMFSCYTTNLDPSTGKTYEDTANFERTLSDIVISEDNNLYYGGECEYILWGGTPSSAVNKTKASIFGIRFILNLIYAMSAPDINALTFEWATVIAGWTVFGVPIVQTVLKIALALAESAYDLNQLCLGKSVPLYKSSTTWAMSPQGMIGIAKEEGKKLIEKSTKYAEKQLNNAITNVFDKIEKTANGKISEITDDVTKYMNQTIRDVSDKVINATVTPFMNGIKGVLGKMDSSWGKDKIKAELQNCLDKLKEGSTDDNYGKCKTIAIEYLEGKVSEVADTIYDSLQEASGVKSDVIIGKINNLFKHIDSATNTETGYIAELNNKLTAEITKLSEGLQNEVTKALNSTEDNAKEKLNEAINNFSNGITEKYTSAVDKVGEAAPNSNTVGDVTNSKAATISLNYKEYLYAFMLIGILANEDNMVARTGYLMQMNISQKMTDAGFEDSDRENFDMTKMYTMVQIHSEADVDSVFMGMFEKKTVNGEESYSLNLDGNGASTDKLVYNGFIGY